MAEILKLQSLIAKLRAKAAAAKKDGNASVVMGYTAAYAVYVHENLEANHPIGQAKFLEAPFRDLKGVLTGIVFELLRKGKTMAQALLVAGLRLQRESQKMVPVDTGALKNSAFTRLEK